MDRQQWGAQAERIADVCRTRLSDLVGVYVHGSAALGGFGPSSDLDVVVVVAGDADWEGRDLGPSTPEAKAFVGERLASL